MESKHVGRLGLWKIYGNRRPEALQGRLDLVFQTIYERTWLKYEF